MHSACAVVGVLLLGRALGGLLRGDMGAECCGPRGLGSGDRRQVTRHEAQVGQVGSGVGDEVVQPGVERGVAAGTGVAVTVPVGRKNAWTG